MGVERKAAHLRNQLIVCKVPAVETMLVVVKDYQQAGDMGHNTNPFTVTNTDPKQRQ